MKRVLIAFVIAVLSLGSTPLFAFGGSEIPLDEEIKQEVVEQLVWDNRVDAAEIKVEVEFGRVTLSGTVPSSFTQQAAIDDAWSVDGVIAVDDNLSIEPYSVSAAGEPLAAAVEGALLIDSQVDSSEITVSSSDGQVTLEGTVAALWQKLRAEEIASVVKGVLGVTNEIAVVPTEDVLDEVLRIKNYITELRRSITPQKSVIDRLARLILPFFSERARIYFRDIADNVQTIADSLETYRDTVAGLFQDSGKVGDAVFESRLRPGIRVNK